ncbi:histidine kinase [Ruminococcaceae bacterium OttesenSCG-928-L11]|nr:histidine kinase [Ruminococcaceae bacterium OttesenSCG-928-L11]
MKATRRSLKQTMKIGLMALLMVLVLFILFYNFYSVALLQAQITESNRRTVAVYRETIDVALGKTERYMINLAAGEMSFNLLSVKDTPINVHSWVWTLTTNMKTQLYVDTHVDGFFLYSKANDAFGYAYDTFAAMEARDTVTGVMKSRMRSGQWAAMPRWQPVQMGEQYYLLRMIEVNGVLMGAVVDLEKLTMDMKQLSHPEPYQIVYTDKQGMPLTNTAFVAETGIDLTRTGDPAYLSGQRGSYWVLGSDLELADVRLAAIVPGRGFLQGLSTLHLMIFFLSVLTVLLIPVVYYGIKTAIITPLDTITTTIRRIGEGQDDKIDLSDTEFEEFIQVRDTFNDMMDQIQDLKIEAYERQLEKQHAQLQYLQLQIKPHFFLNCLKSIYALAEKDKIAEIQEMILGLSGYFRYIFRDNQQTIPVKDELNHVKNYIQLQGLNTQVEPVCHVSVDPLALSLHIPPLTIQTFVENSVYHGARPDVRLEIEISLEVLETDTGQYLDITVSDNGTGFPPEVLYALNHPGDEVYRHQNVGIHNVRLRAKTLYGDEATLIFGNNGRGAVSECILPAVREEIV